VRLFIQFRLINASNNSIDENSFSKQRAKLSIAPNSLVVINFFAGLSLHKANCVPDFVARTFRGGILS
jgi:hypothetical protein